MIYRCLDSVLSFVLFEMIAFIPVLFSVSGFMVFASVTMLIVILISCHI